MSKNIVKYEQSLFILSNEEIKEGDYFFIPDDNLINFGTIEKAWKNCVTPYLVNGWVKSACKKIVGSIGKPQYLYVLSNDNINEGDLVFNPCDYNEIQKFSYNNWIEQPDFVGLGIKKVIASTNLKLPKLSDKFIQEYCDLGDIENALVEYVEKENKLILESTPVNTIIVKYK